MLLLNLPYPPSVNTYYRNFNGRMVLSAQGREYKNAVAEYLIDCNAPKLGDAKLKITMVLRPRDKRKIDIDNRIKAVLDSLQDAGLFDDDYQVDELTIVRGDPIKRWKTCCHDWTNRLVYGLARGICPKSWLVTNLPNPPFSDYLLTRDTIYALLQIQYCRLESCH